MPKKRGSVKNSRVHRASKYLCFCGKAFGFKKQFEAHRKLMHREVSNG